MFLLQIWFKNRRAKFRKIHRKHNPCNHETFDELYNYCSANICNQQLSYSAISMNQSQSSWPDYTYSGSEQKWLNHKHYSPFSHLPHECNIRGSTMAGNVPYINSGLITSYSQPQCCRPVSTPQRLYTLNVNQNTNVNSSTCDIIMPSLLYRT